MSSTETEWKLPADEGGSDSLDGTSACEDGESKFMELSLVDTASLSYDSSLKTSSSSEGQAMEEGYVAQPDSLRQRFHLKSKKQVVRMESTGQEEVSPLRGRKRRRSLPLGLPFDNAKTLTRRTILVLCLAILLFYIWFPRPTLEISLSGWKRLSRRQARKLVRKIESRRGPQPTFTIQLKGGRIDLLQMSLDHHAGCPEVSHVQMEWTSPDNSVVPESILNHGSGKVEYKGKHSTDAVLLLDENLLFSCDELKRAFGEWQLDPLRVVGFMPMSHRGSYSFLFDSAMFVHKLYLKAVPPPPSKNLCRPLMLSASLAAISSKNPVAVLSSPQLIAGFVKRDELTECVPKLLKAVGLKTSSGEKTMYIGRLEAQKM